MMMLRSITRTNANTMKKIDCCISFSFLKMSAFASYLYDNRSIFEA